MSTLSKESELHLDQLPQVSLLTKQALGSDVLVALYNFFKTSETHAPDNNVFTDLLQKLAGRLSEWNRVESAEEVGLALKGDQFFLSGRRIRPKVRLIKKLKYLSSELRRRGLTGFKLPRDAKKEDLNVFLWTLISFSKRQSPSQMTELLRSKGLDGFAFSSLSFGDLSNDAMDLSAAELLFKSLYDFIKLCLEDPQAGENIQSPPSLEAILFELNSLSDEELFSLISVHLVKPEENVSAQMGVLSALILHGWGKTLGLPPYVVVELAGCGLAHVLSFAHASELIRESGLDAMTRTELVLKNIHRFNKIWPITDLQLLTVLEFGQAFQANGTYALNGHRCYQHFFSRMLRIVMLFCQMSVRQKSKPASSPALAIERLLTENLGCDRSLVKLFVSWIGLVPLGSFVELDGGQIGQVTSVNYELEKISRPIVKILRAEGGHRVEAPSQIDLSKIDEKRGLHQVGIKRFLSFEDTGISQEEFLALSSTIQMATS